MHCFCFKPMHTHALLLFSPGNYMAPIRSDMCSRISPDDGYPFVCRTAVVARPVAYPPWVAGGALSRIVVHWGSMDV